jgi:hypothetical protein
LRAICSSIAVACRAMPLHPVRYEGHTTWTGSSSGVPAGTVSCRTVSYSSAYCCAVCGTKDIVPEVPEEWARRNRVRSSMSSSQLSTLSQPRVSRPPRSTVVSRDIQRVSWSKRPWVSRDAG